MADRIKNGLKWVSISTISRNIVGLFQVSILTRLLDKEDFGVIAIASLFVNFTILFTDMGVSSGILHFQNITRKQYSSLFVFNVFFGFVLTSLLYVISPFFVRIYNSEELINIVHILCLSVFINSVGNQQRIVCQKKTKFKRLAIIEILSSFITCIVALVTALSGYGVYSLAYSTIAGVVFNNMSHFVLGILKDNTLSPHFNLSEIIPFLKIGIYSIGSQILDFFTRELDIIIISSTLGLNFLGVYNVAKRISLSMYGFVNPMISKVFTPLLAEIHNKKDMLFESYTTLVSSISLISLPIFLLISALSPTIMYYVFGENFVEGAPIQSVFAIMYGINCFLGTCSSLQIATARTDIGLQWTIFSIICTAIIFYVSSRIGIIAFLIGIIIRTSVDVVFMWLFQFKRMLSISWTKYFNLFKIPLLVSIMLVCPFWILFYYPSYFVSIVGSVLFAILYVLILWQSRFRITMQYLYIRLKG